MSRRPKLQDPNLLINNPRIVLKILFPKINVTVPPYLSRLYTYIIYNRLSLSLSFPNTKRESLSDEEGRKKNNTKQQ